jgi:hypothetical protein
MNIDLGLMMSALVLYVGHQKFQIVQTRAAQDGQFEHTDHHTPQDYINHHCTHPLI